MVIRPIALLAFNGSLQILVSSLLGTAMLVPMQPWGRALLPKLNMKALLAVHLDWLMLAFMQFAAAFVMAQWPLTASVPAAWLLVYSGWMNATPYLFRGFGINAFVLAGPPKQLATALLAGTS